MHVHRIQLTTDQRERERENTIDLAERDSPGVGPHELPETSAPTTSGQPPSDQSGSAARALASGTSRDLRI